MLGPVFIRALYATWRVSEVNPTGWRALRAEKRPFVFALWHGQLLPLVMRHRFEGVKILISEHRDGEMIARIIGRFGLPAIRGLDARAERRARFSRCATRLRPVDEVAVTPDGPRGPARTFASGAIVAAHRAGAPIVAIGVSASRRGAFAAGTGS